MPEHTVLNPRSNGESRAMSSQPDQVTEGSGRVEGDGGAVGLGSIARGSGGFAMVALDQRESLRTVGAEGGGGRGVADGELVAFKRAAVGALAPYASAVLLDDGLAYRPLRD